ncbi:MAG: heme exporter protein CcmB [Pseudomonadota bacterium]
MADGAPETALGAVRLREAALQPFASFAAVVSRELQLAVRRPADVLNPLFFFAVVATLFPLAVSPLPQVLEVIGPGIVWVAALLAALLPLNGLFGQDFDDGTLEHYVMSGQSLVAICFAKTVALWLVAALPLVLVSSLVAETYRLPLQALPVLVLALAVGSFALCALGAVAAALTVGVQRASALIALLVLPLMVPVLIFGTRAVSLAVAGDPVAGPVYLMLAIGLAAALLAPIATALALRISLD